MPVAFDEHNDSPSFGGNAQGRTATRHGKISWSSIGALELELFPPAIAGIPQLPARLPNSLFLFANDYSIKPFHPDDVATNYGSCGTGELMQYEFADVSINYQTIPFQQDDPNADQIITIAKSLSSEFMTLRNVGLKWNGEADTIKDPEVVAGKIVSMMEWNITLHRVPNPPEATYRSLIGKVNQSTFLDASPETLLFAGAVMHQTITSDGSLPWQVELVFVERIAKQGSQAVGWNHFFRDEAGHGQFHRLKTANGDDIYPIDDFSGLI